ncbi:MAG: universal stress protein [Myxococcales bacterium]|nr:universal stress protein [Myxococcales bacterium]
MTVQRILVPVDLSEQSDAALAYAVSLGQVWKAEIHVLNVYHLPAYAFPDGAFLPGPEAVADILDAAQKKVKKNIAAHADSGLTFKSHMVEGSVHEEIAKQAKDIGANLVVMGTHGRTGVSHFVLGSVAERVIRTAECAVMTVRGTESSATPKKILVGYDFSDPADRALAWARSFAETLGASVEVAHVFVDPWEEYRRAGSSVADSAETKYQAYREGLESLLAKAVSKAFGDRAPEVVRSVVTGSGSETLLEHADKKGVDLVCVGTSGKDAVERVLLGSTAQRLVQHSKVPVLTVH